MLLDFDETRWKAYMKRIALSLFAVAVVASVVVAGAQTSSRTKVKAALQSAKDVRGASPYIEIKNEPAPKLIVDAPLPDLLNQGVVWIQWRAEKRAHRTGVREGRPQCLSTSRASTRACGRPALVVGRRERHQHHRSGWDAAGSAQDPDRVGERQSRSLPRAVRDGDVHHTEGSVWLSFSLSLKEVLP